MRNRNLLNHVSALVKTSFNTRNGRFIFIYKEIEEMVDTVVNTLRLAASVRALTREPVYHHVLQSHHDGLHGASSGSRTPSVFISSLPGREGEGCHGQMHCNLLC